MVCARPQCIRRMMAEVNRVTVDITSKPAGIIAWE
jgi:GMP synthase PP-ATPase subunit